MGDSCSRYSPDTDTCITFSNRSCRLQPGPSHDKVVAVTLVRPPHSVPTLFRADTSTSRIVLNMFKTVDDVCRSVRIFPSPSSSITFPARRLHDVHVHSRLCQDLITFWPIFWVVSGSTWQIVTVWQPFSTLVRFSSVLAKVDHPGNDAQLCKGAVTGRSPHDPVYWSKRDEVGNLHKRVHRVRDVWGMLWTWGAREDSDRTSDPANRFWQL